MGVVVVVCVAFGLTILEAKTEIMCLRTKGMPESTATFSVDTADQVYNQINESVYLGGNVYHNADLSIEVNWRIRNAWWIRSTIEGGRGCNKCVPVLRGNGTKIAPTGYIFDQPPGGMSWVRGKLAGHVGGHVVLSPEEGVLVTSPGTESSYPRPSQLLNNSVQLP